MPMKIAGWILAVIAGFLASCAFITVNVYFPEKEVKKAFQTLDEKYLGQVNEQKSAPHVEPDGGENP